MTFCANGLKLVLAAAIFTQLLLTTQDAQAQTTTQDGKYSLAGQCADVLASYMVTTSGVAYGFGSTGNITFTLDPAHSGQSTVTWNFTNKTETWDLYLNANSPLLSALTGGAGASFHMQETSTLPGFNVSTSGGLAWTGTNSGTINNEPTSGSGSGTFTNPGAAGIGAGYPAINLAFDNSTLTGSGTINSIPYTFSQTILAAHFTVGKSTGFAITAVPEANPLIIAALGLMGMSLTVKRKHR